MLRILFRRTLELELALLMSLRGLSGGSNICIIFKNEFRTIYLTFWNAFTKYGSRFRLFMKINRFIVLH